MPQTWNMAPSCFFASCIHNFPFTKLSQSDRDFGISNIVSNLQRRRRDCQSYEWWGLAVKGSHYMELLRVGNHVGSGNESRVVRGESSRLSRNGVSGAAGKPLGHENASGTGRGRGRTRWDAFRGFLPWAGTATRGGRGRRRKKKAHCCETIP